MKTLYHLICNSFDKNFVELLGERSNFKMWGVASRMLNDKQQFTLSQIENQIEIGLLVPIREKIWWEQVEEKLEERRR